ncbi:MAG: RNA-directed DNA polymerase, partial [bacterium]|nr:RNA-directed DNA polymerase [bacterium]
WRAYFEARKHKRWRANTWRFSRQYEENLFRLYQDIKKRVYKIGPSLVFIHFGAVKREIFAGDFRDRIIHHLIFKALSPICEHLFINDCYSCRLNRGTSYGIKRADHFIRAVSKNYSRPGYVMKLDIKGYFMSMNRFLLFAKAKEIVARGPMVASERQQLLYLIKKVIFNDPTQNCFVKGETSDWRGLPKDKSLFFAAPDCGLPIGNLTSQLFGNLYLNEFDHFVKEKLHVKYYGRYVDDLIFAASDKRFLARLIPRISEYLLENLQLKIHSKKIYLQPFGHGLDFLGVIIKPRRIYVRTRLKTGLYRSLKKLKALWPRNQRQINRLGAERLVALYAPVNSYLGIMKNYQTYRLRRSLSAKVIIEKFGKFEWEI